MSETNKGVIWDVWIFPQGIIENNPPLSADQITPAVCCGIFISEMDESDLPE